MHTITAVSALQVARVGVPVAGTGDALAQELVVRGVLVDALVAEGATLAGQPSVTGRADALLHVAASGVATQLHSSGIDDGLLQRSLHLVGVESRSNQDSLKGD